jgi:hypothetical protein
VLWILSQPARSRAVHLFGAVVVAAKGAHHAFVLGSEADQLHASLNVDAARA